jgi:hypothetical protein
MEMIVMRATTMGMEMPVLFAILPGRGASRRAWGGWVLMPVRMKMDMLSPQCKSH